MLYDVQPVASIRSMDCGATCVLMLLDFYGIEATLTELSAECNTRMIGCTMGDMKRAGDAHGLDIHGYEMDAEELLLQDRPAIILWKFSHFVVFCGCDTDGRPVICNPDSGKFHISKSAFEIFYGGKALFNGEPVTVEPTEELTADELADILMGVTT